MNIKKMKMSHAFLILVVTIGVLLSTFSVSAMQAVSMQNEATPPMYVECVGQTSHGGRKTKKESSRLVAQHIMALTSRQKSERERSCCCCPWHINQDVVDDIRIIADEQEVAGISSKNAEKLRNYSSALTKKQEESFALVDRAGRPLGLSAAAIGSMGALIVFSLKVGTESLVYGFPALAICGCCTTAAALGLEVSDFRGNDGLDLVLKDLDESSLRYDQKKCARAVNMDTPKKRTKKRAPAAKKAEDEQDDILQKDEESLKSVVSDSCATSEKMDDVDFQSDFEMDVCDETQ